MNQEAADTGFPTANAAVKLLEGLGILIELTGQKTNRNPAISHTSSCWRFDRQGGRL